MLIFQDAVVESHFAASHSRDSINVSRFHHLLTVASWLALIRSSTQLPGMRAAGVAVALLMIVLQLTVGLVFLDSKTYLRHEKVKCRCFILEATGYVVWGGLLNPRKTTQNISLVPPVIHVVSAVFDQVRLKHLVILCAINTLCFALCQAQASIARHPFHSCHAIIRESCIYALAGVVLPLTICWQQERRKRQAFLIKHRELLAARGFDPAAN
ncbi:hypothetical protein WJX73_005475 [Symbiochloris irregularis]|uniref:Uncharacterized protein n=1 Tax=Symbiochloris irregularis TaxID=706552 RepID=A0AAW1NXV9_9CHLO